MMIAAFFVSAILFFWIAVFLGSNQHLILEYREMTGGALFALGIAPAILFYGDQTGRGFRIALTWAVGLFCGMGAALVLYGQKWGLTS